MMLYRISGLILAATLLIGCQEVEISKPEDVKARFVKLDNTGEPLAVQDVAWDNRWQNNGSPYAHWDCVLDTKTNLIWEVKTSPSDTATTSAANTYSWYEYYTNSGYDPENNEPPELHEDHENDPIAHNPKYAPHFSGFANKGECFSPSGECDTLGYKKQMNAESICGANGTWRLPTVAELKTLNVCTTDTETCKLSNTTYAALDYFPNTRRGYYWSNKMSLHLDKNTPAIDFRTGETVGALKDSGHYIRLVFEAPPQAQP